MIFRVLARVKYFSYFYFVFSCIQLPGAVQNKIFKEKFKQNLFNN